MRLKIFIKTYGCQMNERDSEMAAVLLQRRGFTIADCEKQADIIILNTCSVRAKAEEKAIGKMRLLAAGRKKGRKNLIIGAAGCMVQRMQADIFRQVPGLDFALSPSAFAAAGDVIEKVLAGRRPAADFSEGRPAGETNTHFENKVSAFINVLYGCNRHCSYCIVPAVRGREWSRPAAEIIREAAEVVRNGAREIILLGQSILAYGRLNPVWKNEPESPLGFTEPFPRLLEALAAVNGLKRLRFMSSHPSGCTDELARCFGELPAVCPHVHLPLQSGSDRILKMMNRGYTAAEYRGAVARLRRRVPDIAVTTDIIVGFPAETREDFDLTRAFMEEIGFNNAFIFKYNPRPGTKAAELDDDVPSAEKLRRNHVILEEQNRRSLELNRKLLGRECLALIEGRSRRNPDRWSGRTDGNVLAVFEKTDGCRPGGLVRIKINRAEAQTLYGAPC
ncbi:MAG: tRNA (N6-isopentenyl adenosine(37)-C2)-methylthiotransferase MiaB [Kiritimatiellae bacterium]|nr:tRNA (N6-isopentenyl adenosine(37)-C2)-methylthiotransferase MiaB [Kiritimatiellia bacterium]